MYERNLQERVITSINCRFFSNSRVGVVKKKLFTSVFWHFLTMGQEWPLHGAEPKIFKKKKIVNPFFTSCNLNNLAMYPSNVCNVMFAFGILGSAPFFYSVPKFCFFEMY